MQVYMRSGSPCAGARSHYSLRSLAVSVPVCTEGAVCNLHENGLHFSILKENINILSCMFLGTILLRFWSIQSLANIC